MAEDTKVTVPPTAEELATKAAQDKAEEADKVATNLAAAEAYDQAVKQANLNIVQSKIAYNEARVYAAWGVGAGAVLAGLGILLIGLRK